MHNVTREKGAIERFQNMLQVDQLTGIANRYGFLDQIRALLSGPESICLVVKLDIAQFHNINTGFGYDVGDALLRQVAERLRSLSIPALGRPDADEFGVAAPLTHPSDAPAMLAMITARLTPRYIMPGAEISVRFATGYAVGEPGLDALTLVRRAGAALKESRSTKLREINRSEDGVHVTSRNRIRLTTELQEALARQEFVLEYQPKVELTTGLPVGAEALVRWEHALFGRPPPDRFINLAEETGLILDIGAWSIRTAAGFASQINRHRARKLKFAVNVSTVEFLHRDMVRYVGDILEESKLDPSWLTLELTESILAEQHARARLLARRIDNGKRPPERRGARRRDRPVDGRETMVEAALALKGAISRRSALAGLAASAVLARSGAAAPPPEPVSDALVAAARKEGVVVFHSSIELSVCQAIADGFSKKYPDVRVQLERSGAERILQRITQEYASQIYAADFVESSDMGTFVSWKQKGWLAPYVPVDVAQASWPAQEKDPDGLFASLRVSLSVIAYNSRLIKPEDAPKSFVDLLQPRWRMRLVKAHPSYSGTILTSTYATEKVMGWEYFEKLAKQRVMQVQSAADPPKKVAQGERPVMADGSEYVVLNMKDAGEPIEPVYATEGTPLLSGQAGVMARAPHPNAARLFASYVFSAEGQQLLADSGNLRSFNAGVRPKAGAAKLADIKLLRTDPNELAAAAEEVKRRYTEIFGV